MEQTLFKIEYEKYVLSNGLQVILHQDHTDPIVALAILYHVGSNREEPGKTGFAHFFEHMLFQNSENVGKGNFFKLIEETGGTLNGGTWQDGTVYYEVVPKNALELVLWMESDRMGYMINTVTKEVLENEKEVVKNEKRQRVDNQPYGHTNYVIHKALYNEQHPYNWQVIGSMEDLDQANLNEVKNFYEKYYGPNNATLVLAGDFDVDHVKQLISKYFEEIPKRGIEVELSPTPADISKDIRLMHEDNFGNLPELTITYPTVEETHPDYYALAFLGSILASGKRAPFFKEIVEAQKLAPRVLAGNRSMELAGKFSIKIKAHADTQLDKVYKAVQDAFDRFEAEGIDEKDIEKIKNAQEIEFFQGISSVLNKSFQLAQYNVYRGEPDKLAEEVQALMEVSRQDIIRVYEQYVKNQPAVITSFVPKGKSSLALSGSKRAEVVEEEMDERILTQNPLKDKTNSFIKTPSQLDRSVMPDIEQDIEINFPAIWSHRLNNGLKILGIQDKRLPLVEFSIRIQGGMLFDNPNQIGVANLVTDLMMEGTQDKTPEQLQDAIHQLGSNIQIYTSSELIEIHASTLSRNFRATWDLVQEILLRPRWDQKEFERIKRKTINDIKMQEAKPNIIAGKLFKKLVYGKHILANSTMGEPHMVEGIDLDKIIDFYQSYFKPELSCFHFAGAIEPDEVVDSLKSLEETWLPGQVTLASFEFPDSIPGNSLYFIDIPDAKQTILNIGKLGVKGNDPDLDTLSFLNYKLGGNFNSLLNTQLREERGYTYGVRSRFSRRKNPGMFIIETNVHAPATVDSINLIRETVQNLSKFFTESAVDKIRQIIKRGQARSFETLFQKLSTLEKISTYDLPLDYIDQTIKRYDHLDVDSLKEVILKHLQPSSMIYVVAGDAKTQYQNVEKLGFDHIELVNPQHQITALL